MEKKPKLHDEFDFIRTEEDLADLREVEKTILWPFGYHDRKEQIAWLRQSRLRDHVTGLITSLHLASSGEDSIMSCE